MISDTLPDPTVLSGWSDWMAGTDLTGQPKATGRYAAIGGRCNSDGLSAFYPIKWLSVGMTLASTPDPPTLSNFVRVGATGSIDTVVATATDITIITAFKQLNKHCLSFEVGRRTGSGSIVLDYSEYTFEIEGTPIPATAPVVGQVVNAAGLYSQLSEEMFPSIICDSVPSVEVISQEENGDLNITISGMGDDALTLASWFNEADELKFQIFTGNGDFIITNLTPGVTVRFAALGWGAAGQLGFGAASFSTPAADPPDVPSFDELTNDGTGDSITVTLTPPAQTGVVVIYYRETSSTAWSSVSYTGSPLVQDEHQLTGLISGKIYEVFLQAVSGDALSAPSIPKRCICSSRASALADLLALIKAELTSNIAYAGIVDIRAWDPERLPAFSKCGIVISPRSQTPDNVGCGARQDLCQIEIHGLIWAFNNPNAISGAGAGADAAGILKLRQDIFDSLNANKFNRAVDLIDSDNLNSASPFELIRNGYYYHTVLLYRPWLPQYTG
jgi:hypothetical protein